MDAKDLDSYLFNKQREVNEKVKVFINPQSLRQLFGGSHNVFNLYEELCFPKNEKLTFSLHPYLPLNENVTKTFHRHSFIEMIYVYSGTCYQCITNELITLKQGSLCILDTNVAHFIYTKSKNDIVINCLMRKSYFDSAFLVRLKSNDIFKSFLINALYKSKSSKNYIVFNSCYNEMIHTLICHLLCEYFDPKMCSSEIIDSYMIILFAELLRIYNLDCPSRKLMTYHKTEITEIIDYIYKNYKTLTLESASAHFNLSAKYLSSKIKNLTGHTFMEIVHQIRMEQACSLLLYTNIPVEQVVQEIGYANMNYFYQLFKKQYGTTPMIYRRMHEGVESFSAHS